MILEITYKNYRGEVSQRKIIPISFRYGCSQWHRDEQWLLLAFDIAKNDKREFAMVDMAATGFLQTEIASALSAALLSSAQTA